MQSFALEFFIQRGRYLCNNYQFALLVEHNLRSKGFSALNVCGRYISSSRLPA